MAKYKVLKGFHDNKTHEDFNFGQVADYPDKRAKEINDAGELKHGGPFLEFIEAVEVEDKPEVAEEVVEEVEDKPAKAPKKGAKAKK
jgi:hypothetical protein